MNRPVPENPTHPPIPSHPRLLKIQRLVAAGVSGGIHGHVLLLLPTQHVSPFSCAFWSFRAETKISNPTLVAGFALL